jgi:hypothetical protein
MEINVSFFMQCYKGANKWRPTSVPHTVLLRAQTSGDQRQFLTQCYKGSNKWRPTSVPHTVLLRAEKMEIRASSAYIFLLSRALTHGDECPFPTCRVLSRALKMVIKFVLSYHPHCQWRKQIETKLTFS